MTNTVMDGMIIGEGLERIPLDHYPTPYKYALEATRKMRSTIKWMDFPNVLDVGAGTGVWGKAVREVWRAAHITGVEIDTAYQATSHYNDWRTLNILGPRTDMKFDVIIGNPPYKDVEEIIRISHNMLEDYGYMGFLLRLSFLESIKRGMGLWKELPPEEVSISMNRISFSGDGKSNTTAYAFYLWAKRPSGNTKLTWMNWKGTDDE